MSHQATAAVWDHQVGGGARKLVLLAYANEVDSKGRGSQCGYARIARFAECSIRQAQRHVAALVTDGWMRPGDQRLVSHIDPRHRPTVYDVALDEETRQAWLEAGDRAGRRAAAVASGRVGGLKAASLSRGDTDVTPTENASPDTDVTPSRDVDVTPSPDTDDTARGDIEGRPGVSPVSPTPKNYPQTKPPTEVPADADATAAVRNGQASNENEPATLDLPGLTSPTTTPGDEPTGPTPTQLLIGEWIEHRAAHDQARPNGQVLGQVSKLLKQLLEQDGVPYGQVRSGLIAWAGKDLHPSALPSCVDHAGRSVTTARSTTDDRVAAVLALRERFAAEAGQPITPALTSRSAPWT